MCHGYLINVSRDPGNSILVQTEHLFQGLAAETFSKLLLCKHVFNRLNIRSRIIFLLRFWLNSMKMEELEKNVDSICLNVRKWQWYCTTGKIIFRNYKFFGNSLEKRSKCETKMSLTITNFYSTSKIKK